MCGDGIITMWNVKYVKQNLSQNTLTRSVVLMLVEKRQGLLQLGSTRTAKRVGSALIGGIKVLLVRVARTDTEAKKSLNTYKSLGRLTTTRETPKLKGNTIRNMLTVGVDIMQDMLIGKQLIVWKGFV